MPDPRPTQVRFGPFLCDARTGEIWKAGRPVRLQEQPRQLLVALLQHPGEVLSRDQLRRRLWPDDTFVDFDNALNVGIRKIREGLGDVAPTPRYIETVRGQGYRFVAPILPERTIELQPVAAMSQPASMSSGAPPAHRRLRPALVAAGIVVAAATAWTIVRPASPGLRISSLAVLPFDNLLGGEERQYLVDGLSEALTRQLAAGLDVRVIASQSAFALTDRSAPLAEAANRLGADALLVGSVAREGAGVVINVRLMDKSGDRPRWTGRFERSLDELSIPDPIVDAVASAIGRMTSPPIARRATAVVAPEARDAYLRGRFFWAKRGRENLATAARYLSTAIQLQPDYAEAWAALAEVYAVDQVAPSPVIVPWPGDSIEGGLRAAHEALRLAPDLGEAYAALGKLYVTRRRWSDAERSFARAVELNPQYSTARQWYGTMFARLRRCDEALEQVELAARLDPLTALVNEAVGSVYLGCGEPQRAIEVFDSVLEMHPAALTTRYRRVAAYSRLGRHDDAIRELESLAVSAQGDAVTGALALAYATAGRAGAAHATLAKLTAPFLRARVHAALGESQRMWAMLEQSLAHDADSLQNLLASSEFEAYRHDLRFIEFARRAGFPTPIRDARFSNAARPVVTSAGR